MRVSVALLLVIAGGAPAWAQSTYVGGAFIGEFARYGGVDVDEADRNLSTSYEGPSRNGESVGFDLRVGRALAEHWGVEFSFARGGAVSNSVTRRISPLRLTNPVVIPGFPTLPTLPVPDFEFEFSNDMQHTTVDALAWFRQDLSARTHLAVLGGVSFTRIEDEQRIDITDQRLALLTPLPFETESTRYASGPVVGIEAIVDVGEHAAITGGVRLHGGFGGWLVRPSVGLRWGF